MTAPLFADRCAGRPALWAEVEAALLGGVAVLVGLEASGKTGLMSATDVGPRVNACAPRTPNCRRRFSDSVRR